MIIVSYALSLVWFILMGGCQVYVRKGSKGANIDDIHTHPEYRQEFYVRFKGPEESRCATSMGKYASLI